MDDRLGAEGHTCYSPPHRMTSVGWFALPPMTASMCMSFSSLLFTPIRYWAQPILSSKSSVCLACPLRSFRQFCTLQPRIHGPLKGGPDHSLHDSSNDLLDFVIQRMPVAHQDGDQPTDLQMDSRPPRVAFGSDGAQSVEALSSLDLLTSLIDHTQGVHVCLGCPGYNGAHLLCILGLQART